MRSRSWMVLCSALVALSCSDSTGLDVGKVSVSATVSGPDATLDGLAVTIDGEKSYGLGSGASVVVSLDMGHHTLAYSGLAPHCHLLGPASVSVGVNAGETTDVSVGVGCTALTGVVEVRTSTTGLDLDSDGYQIALDGATPLAIPTNGTLLFPNQAGGTHAVVLSGTSDNCTFLSAEPTEVVVETGGETRDTARVTIAISCTATSAVIMVQATTQGPDPDLNGYSVVVGDGLGHFLPPNGILGIAPVGAGTYSLTVSGLASNCVMLEANPQHVTVSVGGTTRDTALVPVHVTCTATTGAIRVGVTATGSDVDLEYALSVDGQNVGVFSASLPIIAGHLLPGVHSVALSGVASNCTVQSDNPAAVTVTVGDTTAVGFQVACDPYGRTGADITLTSVGPNLPATYHLTIEDYCYWYTTCTTRYSADVPVNGTVAVDLPGGDYSYSLSGVPQGCFGAPSGYFYVASHEVTSVSISINCNPLGAIQLSVPLSGFDLDTYFSVFLDGQYLGWITGGTTQTYQAPSGTHALLLNDIAPNCAVTGANPAQVTVDALGLAVVSMPVSCAANPTLRTTVGTAGANIPATFLVGVDQDWYYGYYYSANVPSNGSASLKVAPGEHQVWLDQVPANCTVNSPNPLTLNVPLGSTTDVAFAVTCQ